MSNLNHVKKDSLCLYFERKKKKSVEVSFKLRNHPPFDKGLDTFDKMKPPLNASTGISALFLT